MTCGYEVGRGQNEPGARWAIVDRGQVRWHCRRGMKELDVLLQRWLDRRYDAASSDERASFEAFLELPDPELARYLLRGEPVPARFRPLLAVMLRADAGA
jgi:antitoxin CptB